MSEHAVPSAAAPSSGPSLYTRQATGLVREISVGYTFDSHFVKSTLGLSTIDLRLAGRNLKTWTRYTGYDPETNLGGATGHSLGLDYFNQPQTRSFVITIGLNR